MAQQQVNMTPMGEPHVNVKNLMELPAQKKSLVQEDPFSSYPTIGTGTDTPINYGGGIAESLLNDDEVPESIRLRFWNVFHKDNVLTFLDERRKENKLIGFDIQKIDILNCLPYYKYTFERELEFDMLRTVLETKLDRALGFTGTTNRNERIVLQSQFSEQRMISENDQTGAIKEGFFKRLLKRR